MKHRNGKVRSATLSGAESLTVRSREYQSLDCGGAGRTITLPAEEISEGLTFSFYNTSDAAEMLTINNDAASEVVAVAPGYSARVACTGAAWVRV